LSSKRIFWLTVKLLGTGLFIVLIARKVDLSALLPIIRQCRWEWFFASVLLQYGAAGLNAIRWRMLWPLPGLPLHKYLYFVFLGYFFNAFLPSAALSDAVRVLAFGRKYGNIQENIGVNLLARAMGACAQLLVAGVIALIYFKEWKDLRLPVQLQWNSGAVLLLVLVVAIAVAAWFTRSKWRRWRWTQVIFAVLGNKSLAMRTFLLSLFLQVVLAGGIFTLYYSLYPETRFWHMALFPLLIQIGLLIPLTVGGIGMREYLSLVFFSDVAGMPADVVLGVSLLGYIPFLLMAFTGGGWMLFRQIGNGATEKQDGT
jgi:glycosyltransferase 2 family protein